MDRIQQFEGHQIHKAIDSLEEKIKDIPTDNLDVARIRKILEYIKKYLKLIDADLLNDSHIHQLAQIQTQVNNCNSYIRSKSKAQSVTSIELSISNLLTLPIQVKYSKESISSILKAYNDSIQEGLEQIDLVSTKESSDKIKALEKQLFEDYENEKGIDILINDKYKYIKESYSEINEYYNEVFGNDNSIKSQVKIAKDKILEVKTNIEKKAEDVENKLENFKKYYKKVFGYENEDGEKIIGLKKELEERENDLLVLEDSYKTKLEELEENHKMKYKTLEDEINSLVNGATSVGLSKAFDEESKNYNSNIGWWNFVFIASIGIMCAIYVCLSYLGNDMAKNNLDILSNFIIRLPYILPFIWLGFYAGNRRNESTRLKHEYIHKSTLAKSYISYKNQIDGLQDTDETLIKKLLESAIDTVGYNPSQTLDKNNNDRTPITELIKLAVEKTVELAKKKGDGK